MTKNKWMKYILKIRNKQINKVKLQERKKNTSIKYNIYTKEELKKYYNDDEKININKTLKIKSEKTKNY